MKAEKPHEALFAVERAEITREHRARFSSISDRTAHSGQLQKERPPQNNHLGIRVDRVTQGLGRRRIVEEISLHTFEKFALQSGGCLPKDIGVFERLTSGQISLYE